MLVVAKDGSFTPTQLASLYNFPSATGQGECVGIVELGGGYRPADLQAYFAQPTQWHSIARSVDRPDRRRAR